MFKTEPMIMDIKKILFYIVLVSIFGAFNSCWGQNRTNNISCEEYGNITFNGATIDQINATEGDPQELQRLVGSFTSIQESDTFWERTFKQGNNTLIFNYKKGNVNGHVTNILINDDQWPVNIKGHTIKVGDSVADLKQAFGSDLIVGESKYFTEHFVTFGCAGNDYDGWVININPETNKIFEITYFVNP